MTENNNNTTNCTKIKLQILHKTWYYKRAYTSQYQFSYHIQTIKVSSNKFLCTYSDYEYDFCVLNSDKKGLEYDFYELTSENKDLEYDFYVLTSAY